MPFAFLLYAYLLSSQLLFLSLHLPSPFSQREREREMSSSIFTPAAKTILKQNQNPLLQTASPLHRQVSCKGRRRTTALLSTTKEAVLKDFHQRRALKVNIQFNQKYL